jgi:hypothetical protein
VQRPVMMNSKARRAAKGRPGLLLPGRRNQHTTTPSHLSCLLAPPPPLLPQRRLPGERGPGGRPVTVVL